MENPFLEKNNSAGKSLFILLLLTLGCAIFFQLIAFIIALLFTDVTLTNLASHESASSFGNKSTLYLILAVGLLGTFLAPALFLQRLESYNTYFPNDKLRQLPLIALLTIAVLFAFGPAMEWIGAWNQNMQLPESLSNIERWMREQEDKTAELTKNIVMVDSWGLLMVNILVMAVVPAVAEEFYFRGSLIHIAKRMFGNAHAAIWIVAFVFSFIHFQFYGFFPRMILGVFFGYMLLWTGNIWIPILGHFINNATVTIIAFYYTREGKTFEELQDSTDSYSFIVYLGSFILTALLAYLFYKKTVENKTYYGKGLD